MQTISDVIKAHHLFEDGDYYQALEIYKEVYDQSLEEGTESHYLLYYMAYCHLEIGNTKDASYFITKAIQKDPYNITVDCLASHIFGAIISEIKGHLFKADKKDKVKELYNFCRNNGRVTSNLQFLMIQHYMHFNEYKTAKFMLDNALERNPYDKDFLKMRKKIALEENDQKKLDEIERNSQGVVVREVQKEPLTQ